MFDVILAPPPIPFDAYVKGESTGKGDRQTRTWRIEKFDVESRSLLDRANAMNWSTWFYPALKDGNGRFLGTWCVWCHIDSNINRKAITLLKSYHRKPTWVMWAGSSFTAVWALSTFQTDDKEVGRVLRLLADDLGGEKDFAKPGARLRMPGSWLPNLPKKHENNSNLRYAHLVKIGANEKREDRMADETGRFALTDFVSQKLFQPPDPSKIQTFRLDELMQQDIAPMRWAVEGILPEGLSIFAGSVKAGKAQPLDALIAAPFGWIPMGRLKVGDEVIGRDGKPTKVVAVHPQGKIPLYRVTMCDGTSVETSAEHLWETQTHYERNCRKTRLRTTAEIQDMLQRMDTRNRESFIPMCGPIEYNRNDDLPLHPYLLGVLIGDGGLTQCTPTITKKDEDLFANVSAVLPPGTELRKRAGRYCQSIRVTKGRTPNPVKVATEQLGLAGKKSPEKFIPGYYLLASVKDRWALLQGLMDTDGSVEQKSLSYATSSMQLAVDIRHLVESLGGTARVNVKFKCGYKKPDGTYKRCLPCNRITIKLPRELGCPFSIERKAERWRKLNPGVKKVPSRKIVSVEYSRDAEAQCITVDAPDGLYVTEHFIVTHNSWLALDIGLSVAMGAPVLGHATTVQGEVLYLALEDGERRMKERAEALLSRPGYRIDPHRLHCVFSWKPLDDNGFEELDAWLKAHPDCRLVMIDTYAKIRPTPAKHGNVYLDDYKVTGDLKALADRHHVAILLVTHKTKSRGAHMDQDFVESIMGSTGVTGAADAILVLSRGRQGRDAVLHITGRDVAGREIPLAQDASGGWKVRELGPDGDDPAPRLPYGEKTIDLIKALAKIEPATAKDIADATKRTIPATWSTLKSLETRGIVEKSGRHFSLKAKVKAEMGL